MANQRIGILNKETGQWINLAKWYPDTGWSSNDPTLQAFLDAGTSYEGVTQYDVALGEHPFQICTENQLPNDTQYVRSPEECITKTE